MRPLSDLRVKIFADGADVDAIARLACDPLIKGFTTNPTLMRAAGVADYEAFAKLPEGTDPGAWLTPLRPRLEKNRVRARTVVENEVNGNAAIMIDHIEKGPDHD